MQQGVPWKALAALIETCTPEERRGQPPLPVEMLLHIHFRAKVEHPFRVIKRQFGHTKARDRGSAVAYPFVVASFWMDCARLLMKSHLKPLMEV